MPDSVILLDLIPDRYLLLKDAAAGRFKRMIDGQTSSDDRNWLAARGFSSANCHCVEDSIRKYVQPARSTFGDRSHKPSRLQTMEALLLQLLYRQLLKRKPLFKLLEHLENYRPCKPSEKSDGARAIAQAFVKSKHFIRSKDKCLSQALAMTYMLFRRGIDADLIFGVTMPFSAHCWVQIRDEVLTDPLDRVRPFTPILMLP